MKSNLAIIEDNAKFNLSKTDKKPKVSTVAEGVQITSLKESNPIFSRPFGKEGHTLGEAIDHQATVYKSLVKQRKGQLEKLKGIGEVLIELRSVSGASDKDYGKLVSKTPLGVMSRQDRSDAMWLATEWQSIEKFMKDMDMSSASAAYLRQQMRKASKPKAEADDVESTEGSKSTDSGKATQGGSTAECSTVKQPKADKQSDDASVEVSTATETEFAQSMADIAKAEGLDLAKVIAALQALA
jgi:hypothetical protein